eukprot:scaffold2721_cov194-Chaetoceros_neogracile.AAC.3
MPFQSVLPFFSSKCVGENSLIHRRQAGRQTDRQTDVQLLSTVFPPVLEDHWLHRSKAKELATGKRIEKDATRAAAACLLLAAILIRKKDK